MKHKKNISKFGKSSSALLKIKKNFISENGFYVQEQNRIAKLYSNLAKKFVKAFRKFVFVQKYKKYINVIGNKISLVAS